MIFFLHMHIQLRRQRHSSLLHLSSTHSPCIWILIFTHAINLLECRCFSILLVYLSNHCTCTQGIWHGTISIQCRIYSIRPTLSNCSTWTIWYAYDSRLKYKDLAIHFFLHFFSRILNRWDDNKSIWVMTLWYHHTIYYYDNEMKCE